MSSFDIPSASKHSCERTIVGRVYLLEALALARNREEAQSVVEYFGELLEYDGSNGQE